MGCKHCDAAYSALLELIVDLKVEVAHVQEAITEHDAHFDAIDMDIEALLAEDEPFESEDEYEQEEEEEEE